MSKTSFDTTLDEAWIEACGKLEKTVRKGQRKIARKAAKRASRNPIKLTLRKADILAGLSDAAARDTTGSGLIARTAVAQFLNRGVMPPMALLKSAGIVDSLLKARPYSGYAGSTDTNEEIYQTPGDLSESSQNAPRRPAGRTPGRSYGTRGQDSQDTASNVEGVRDGREGTLLHLGGEGDNLAEMLRRNAPPDPIAELMGVRRQILPAGGFGGDSQAPGSSHYVGEGSVERSGFDYNRHAGLADSEPDEVARVQGEVSAIPEGMSELVNDERGIPSYDFWSNRHARMSCVTPADFIQAVPVAVNAGRLSQTEGSMYGQRASKGQLIPEKILRLVMDGRPGEK